MTDAQLPRKANPILGNIPRPSPKHIALHLYPAAERALRQGHPWLFATGIRKQSHNGRSGDLAVIFDRKNRFLAVGLYDPDSPLRVRVLQQKPPQTINQAWFLQRLQKAFARRQSFVQSDTTGYRLVHGENDGLPGLVIDRYAAVFVFKLYAAAWIPQLPAVLAAFLQLLPPDHIRCIVLRLSRNVQANPVNLFGLEDGMLLYGRSLPKSIQFLENGLTFEVDVVHGQKTGFFLDQRDNRQQVEKLAKGKTVLNLFAYSGGFSLYAARGGAYEIVSVDLSQPALATAARHFKLNQEQHTIAAANHELIVADVFQALKELKTRRRRFDLVIIDPPAFAKRAAEVARALAAYSRLVRLGVGVLKRGGILVMASCSSRVEAEQFFATVHQAARKAKRPLQEIARTGHTLDHPVGFKEGAYLKCLFARVP